MAPIYLRLFPWRFFAPAQPREGSRLNERVRAAMRFTCGPAARTGMAGSPHCVRILAAA